MSWGNKFCSWDGNCSPVDTTEIIHGDSSNTSMQKNRTFSTAQASLIARRKQALYIERLLIHIISHFGKEYREHKFAVKIILRNTAVL
jgi:hypothetical protein